MSSRPDRSTTKSSLRSCHELDNVILFSRLAQGRATSEAVELFADEAAEDHAFSLRQLSGIVRARQGGRAVVSNGTSPRLQRSRSLEEPDEEAIEAAPLDATRTGASGSGQESGLSGTRSRDVQPGETGANRVVGGGDRLPSGAGGGSASRVSGSGGEKSVAEEMRERDRQLDAFDRAGRAPEAKADEEADRMRIRAGIKERGPARIGTVPPRDDLAMILQEFAAERRLIGRRELEETSDQEFDKAFMNLQLHLHLDLLAILRLADLHGSPALRSVVAQTEDLCLDHLDQARMILQELHE